MSNEDDVIEDLKLSFLTKEIAKPRLQKIMERCGMNFLYSAIFSMMPMNFYIAWSIGGGVVYLFLCCCSIYCILQYLVYNIHTFGMMSDELWIAEIFKDVIGDE